MIPGENLLLDALDIIGSQQPMFYKAVTPRAAPNAAGYYEPAFEAGVLVPLGSIQPIPRSKYEIQGLEASKKYVMWYVPQNVVALERDTSGDQFEYAGERYQTESVDDWFQQDGWLAVLAVKVGPQQ